MKNFPPFVGIIPGKDKYHLPEACAIFYRSAAEWIMNEHNGAEIIRMSDGKKFTNLSQLMEDAKNRTLFYQ